MTVYRHGKEGVWLIVEQDWTGAVSDAAPVNELDPHPVVALTFDDLPAAGSLPPGENRTKIATKMCIRDSSSAQFGAANCRDSRFLAR